MPTYAPGSAAASYSQFAGVLASLALACLVVYLGRHYLGGKNSDRADIPAHDVAAGLFYSIAALAICSFLYANLSSAPANNQQAVAAMIPYGVALGLSVLALFYVLTLMLFEHEITKQAAKHAYWIVVVAGPAVVTRFLTSAAFVGWQFATPKRTCPGGDLRALLA